MREEVDKSSGERIARLMEYKSADLGDKKKKRTTDKIVVIRIIKKDHVDNPEDLSVVSFLSSPPVRHLKIDGNAHANKELTSVCVFPRWSSEAEILFV